MALIVKVINGQPVVVDSSATGVPLSVLPKVSELSILGNVAKNIALRGLAQSHTVDPTENDLLYDIGAFWFNHNNRKLFVCSHNTTKAVWEIINDEPPSTGNALFVAPYGNDSNLGTISSPKATISGAAAAIRAGNTATNVYLRGGTYRVTEPTVLTPDDSGERTTPITYANYPGESPIINGAVVVTGAWIPTGSFYYTQLPPTIKPFRTLVVDNQMAKRARFPTTGFHEMFPYLNGSPVVNDHFYLYNGNVPTGIRAVETGINNINPLEAIAIVGFIAARTNVTSSGTDATGIRINTTLSTAGYNYRSDYGRYFLENSLSFLDSAGEWYLDRSIAPNRLFYYPLVGTNISGSTIEIPQTNTMLFLEGRENYLNITGSMTVAFWMNTTYKFPTTTGAGFEENTIIHNKDGGSGFMLGLRHRYGISGFPHMEHNATYNEAWPMGPVTSGNWEHLLYTINKSNNTMTMYRNAISGQTSGCSAAAISRNPIVIGQQDSTNKYSGLLDELIIIDSAVTGQSQATNIMNRNYAGFNVIARMPFDLNYNSNSTTLSVVQKTNLYESSANVATSGNITFTTGINISGRAINIQQGSSAQHLSFLTFKGHMGVPISHVNISGIDFRNCDYPSGVQTNYGDDFFPHMSGAIYARFIDNCKINNCEFQNVNTSAITLHRCRNMTLQNNSLSGIGYNGMTLLGSLDSDGNYNNHTIENNVIQDCGRVIIGSCGIYIQHLGHLKIRYNHLFDLPFLGIRTMGALNSLAMSPGNSEISYNHIHNVSKQLTDGAGIYSAGYSKNTVIKNNRIHDIVFTDLHIFPTGTGYVGASRDSVRGIYLDEGSLGVTVSDNLVYNCQHSNLFMHLTSSNTVRNNKFLNVIGDNCSGLYGNIYLIARDSLLGPTGQLIYPTGNSFVNNICYSENTCVPSWRLVTNNSSYFSSNISGRFGVQDKNFYANDIMALHYDSGPGVTGTISLFTLNYQMESGSMSGYPGIQDSEHGSFQIVSNHPAVDKLGFVDFDSPYYI